MVTLSSAAVVPSTARLPRIVGLHAGFGGERGDGAGGAGRARVDGHWKLDEFVADLGLGHVGDIGGNHRRGGIKHDHCLGLGARLQHCIQTAGFARGQRDSGERLLFKARRPKCERIGAHIDVLEGIASALVGGDGQLGRSAGICQRHLRALNQRSAGIAHRAQNRAEGRLGRQTASNNRQQEYQEKSPAGRVKQADKGRNNGHGFAFQENGQLGMPPLHLGMVSI